MGSHKHKLFQTALLNFGDLPARSKYACLWFRWKTFPWYAARAKLEQDRLLQLYRMAGGKKEDRCMEWNVILPGDTLKEQLQKLEKYDKHIEALEADKKDLIARTNELKDANQKLLEEKAAHAKCQDELKTFQKNK
jgi:predicted transcriptional regulator